MCTRSGADPDNGVYVHDRRSGKRLRVAQVPAPALKRHELDELYGVAITDGLERGLGRPVPRAEAVDLAWAASGRVGATIVPSNLPWDVSGGVLLVREAGGVAVDSTGPTYWSVRSDVAAGPSSP